MAVKSLLRKFMEKVNSDWKWMGAKSSNGYGHMGVNGKTIGAHQISYELFNGPVPEGLCVLHDCDDPTCIDPEHLHLGTLKDNAKEAYARGRIPKFKKGLAGQENHNAKLSSREVIAIRRLLDEGYSRLSLAERFGVTVNNIDKIALRRTWKNV